MCGATMLRMTASMTITADAAAGQASAVLATGLPPSNCANKPSSAATATATAGAGTRGLALGGQEGDVQEVYFSRMVRVSGCGELEIENENGQRFLVDVKSRSARALP